MDDPLQILILLLDEMHVAFRSHDFYLLPHVLIFLLGTVGDIVVGLEDIEQLEGAAMQLGFQLQIPSNFALCIQPLNTFLFHQSEHHFKVGRGAPPHDFVAPGLRY